MSELNDMTNELVDTPLKPHTDDEKHRAKAVMTQVAAKTEQADKLPQVLAMLGLEEL